MALSVGGVVGVARAVVREAPEQARGGRRDGVESDQVEAAATPAL
ncbi:hypothetical protein [Streptomyces sviceus]